MGRSSIPEKTKKNKVKPLGLVKSLLGRILGGGGKKPSSVPVALILGGLVTLVLAINNIRLILARNKIAKLAQEVVVLKEDKAKVAHEHKVAKQTDIIKAASKNLVAIDAKIKSEQAKINHLKESEKTFAEALKTTNSWADIKIK